MARDAPDVFVLRRHVLGAGHAAEVEGVQLGEYPTAAAPSRRLSSLSTPRLPSLLSAGYIPRFTQWLAPSPYATLIINSNNNNNNNNTTQPDEGLFNPPTEPTITSTILFPEPEVTR